MGNSVSWEELTDVTQFHRLILQAAGLTAMWAPPGPRQVARTGVSHAVWRVLCRGHVLSADRYQGHSGLSVARSAEGQAASYLQQQQQHPHCMS